MKINKTLILAGCLLAMGSFAPSLHAQAFTFTTVAGGSQGSADGLNADASFNGPTGVAVDSSGNLFVADQKNDCIRQIQPQGTNWIVTTIAGGAQGILDGAGAYAQFSSPTGIVIDRMTNLYVSDQVNHAIRKITLVSTNWVVSTIAGQPGVFGTNDGANASAQFHNPMGVAMDSAGNIFVADEFNNAIRKMTPSGTNWIVSTIAGGSNAPAQFADPAGVAVDATDRVFVADQFNNTIRLITPSGTNWIVSTIAGRPIAGLLDGLGTNALFDTPVGIAVDANDHVFVADLYNEAIRELVPSGTNWEVSTPGGGPQGSNNGTGSNASFNLPFAVAVDAYGDIFVADSGNNAIRMGIPTNSPAATGSLEVTISPSNAISAGAQWQLDGGPAWLTNGMIVTGLVPGDHAITFDMASGYTTPAAQTVSVTARQTTLATANYAVVIANAGSLQVMISPFGAVHDGAQWQVDNGAWQTNGGIVAGLTVGPHALSFNPVSGWTTPPSQTVAITNGQTTSEAGMYILQTQTDSLQVTVLPSTIATIGAQWQVDGSSNQISGATMTNLSTGVHTLSFTPIFKWNTPADQTFTITNGQAASAVGIYTAFAPSSDGLVLVTNGSGTIQHAAWPKSLVIGKKYTVTAAPKPGNVFSNWAGGTSLPYSLQLSSAACAFIMQSNMVLEASFVTNVFLTAQGAYRGLFAPTNSIRQQSASGSFLLNVTKTGAASGSLALAGQTVPLSGKFNLGGAAEIVSKRPGGELSLTTTLQLDFTNQSVSGAVSNGAFNAQLYGDRNVFSQSRQATEFEGRYTVIIPGTNDPAVGPFGVSYGTVNVSALGAITLAGSLADGTAISQSSEVSKDGYWPLYVNLYGGKGSLWGWSYFTNHTLVAVSALSWINESNPAKNAMYRSGFTNQQAALAGGLYASSFTLPADFTATLAGGNLLSVITITNGSGNTNHLLWKANKTTGAISGSFANPSNPKQTVKIYGVLLPGRTNAEGYFPGTSQTGAFTLAPPL